MQRLRLVGGHILIVAGLALLFSTLPLGTAVTFEVDEGYEVIKPYLVGHGFSLYSQIWDDQPPLFTLLIQGAFHICGISILSARLVAATFAVVLFLAFYELIRTRFGAWTGLLAVFFLLASPYVLLLSVAVMQEVPTLATALLAAALLPRSPGRRAWSWLLLSGAVMGFALQIKFTAALVAPAILAEIVVRTWNGRSRKETPHARKWQGTALFHISAWCAAAAVVFGVIGLAWGRGSAAIAWKAHALGHAAGGFGAPQDLVFPANLVLKHGEVVGAAVLGLILGFGLRRWRECLMPSVLLLTAVAVHSIHRPWWNYYYLHFAVPLAWFAGVFACEAFVVARESLARTGSTTRPKHALAGLGLLGVVGFMLAFSERRLEASAERLRTMERIRSSPVLAAMQEYASGTRWVYCDLVIYAFHARLLVPPELAVTTLKRIWSGQTTTEQIVATCERYQVEQLVLTSPPGPHWKRLLEGGYSPICTNRGLVVYVSKQLSGGTPR